MAFCPRCGQSYAEGLEYCLYCEYDLRQVPAAQASSAQTSPPAAVVPQVPERRRVLRNLFVIVGVVIIALYALAALV